MTGRVAWRVLITLAVGLAGASRLEAQARLTGVVRDTTGRPIAGVEVSVQGISRTVLSDGNGNFQLAGIPAGQSVVTLRRVGFAPQSTILKFVDGDNRLPDAVLIAMPITLDTVRTREDELLREYPLLRAFEEHRKMGLGQFVTRQQLEMHRGGFLTPVLNQMRGIVIIRSTTVSSNAWIANSHVPTTTCTVMEDRLPNEALSPVRDANCRYCFPEFYLDRTKMNRRGEAANVGRYSPDMLQAIEIFANAAETPPEYISGQSGCGTVIFHTRVPDIKPRVFANRQDGPTRSKVLVAASLSSAKSGSNCSECGIGAAQDVTVGYTLRDRWVISSRYTN